MTNITLIVLLALAMAIVAAILWCYRLSTKLGAARSETATVQRQSARQENELIELRERVVKETASVSRLETQLANTQTQADEKIAFLKELTAQTEARFTESQAQMQTQFKVMAQSVLDEKSRVFDEHSQQTLLPLREKLDQFRQRIDEIYGEETRARAALKNEIQNLQNNAAKIGEDAANLTRALKGDKKMQGDWGELTLSRLLEESGLREGEGYKTQPSLQGKDGAWQRPDVIIQLPEGRHLIVDSKVSLVDYVNAVAANDENTRTESIRRHAQAVRKHMKDLSERHYQFLKGVNTPDFVFMFMPQEPAFSAALNADRQLFSDAYDKKIILCAPTTLLATLRTVEGIWRLERQNKNAEKIAQRGGTLYDKMCGFVDDMEKIDKALTVARKSYDEASKKLSTGQGNLLWQADELCKMGVPTRKQLPLKEK